MRPFARALLGAAPLVWAFVAFACTDDTVRFGPPGGLQGKEPNDTPPAASGAAPGPGGEAGGGGNGCTKPPADAGPDCPTFATIWTKYMAPTAEWGCGKQGCHSAGGQAPQPLTDQQATYKTLLDYKIVTKAGTLPYINPNCVEPAQSSIMCNVAKQPGSCGLDTMPSGVTPSAASLTDLQKWVACGSPP
jgi:hypothetical protein